MLQIEAMLEPFESLFDAPALVVEVAKLTGRKAFHVKQVRHQDTHLPVWRDVTDQTNLLRPAGAPEVQNILMICCPQRDDLLVKSAAQEVAHARETGVAGLLDAHAKRDFTLIQHRYQPAAGIAPVKEQQVTAAQTIKMLKQHLPLTCLHTVQRGRQHQFGAGQKQPKGNLISQRGALDVACAQSESHGRGVGGDQSQAMPERDKAIVLSALDHPIVEQRDGGQGQLGACLRKRLAKAPKGWSAGLRVDEKEGRTSFVWTPGLKDTDSYGVEPGRSQSGFAVLRPELPGVARTYLQGRIAEPWGLDGLPETPFWTAKVDEIEDLDYLLVPVLAPIIPVPNPYNGAELARRLKAHVQTWLKYGHINADALTRLNRQFEVLIPALEINNKQAARAAVIAIRKECADRNSGLGDDKAGEDDDHDSAALPRTPAQRSAAPALALDRVAARALLFDLRYLMDRMDSGR